MTDAHRVRARVVRKATLALAGACLLSASPAQAEGLGRAAVIAEGATLHRAASGFTFTEGPAVDAEGNVYFTDQPSNRILKWSADEGVSVFMRDAGRANGLFVDADGSLLACADENNQLWRISQDGTVEVLLADFKGKRFNGPNDLWVAPDGGIYFTDPYYQRDYWTRTGPELAHQAVYYLSPEGALSVADDRFTQPNGIVGSATGDRLYVADIGANRTWVYDRHPDGRLANRREFAAMGSDGMTIDNEGNVYLTGDGVAVFAPSGERIADIPVEEDWTANVTFAGKDRSVLFITAMGSIYTLDMAVRGAR